MQATLGIEVMPLETQGLVEPIAPCKRKVGNFAEGVVPGRPDNFASATRQLMRRPEVIKLVVKRAGLVRPFAVEQGQRAEATGFVKVATVMIVATFGDEMVTLPEELGDFAVDGFADATTESIVAVAGAAAIRERDAD